MQNDNPNLSIEDGLARRVISTLLIIFSLGCTSLPLQMFMSHTNTKDAFVGLVEGIVTIVMAPICVVVGLVLAILARDMSKSQARRAVARAVMLLDLLLIGLMLIFFAWTRSGAV